MPDPRIRIYLDDTPDPVTDQRPPTEIALNTQSLADGEQKFAEIGNLKLQSGAAINDCRVG